MSLGITHKIFGAFGLILILLVASAIVAWTSLNNYSSGVYLARSANLFAVEITDLGFRAELFLENEDLDLGAEVSNEFSIFEKSKEDRYGDFFTSLSEDARSEALMLSNILRDDFENALRQVSLVERGRQTMADLRAEMVVAIEGIDAISVDSQAGVQEVQRLSNETFIRGASVSQTLTTILDNLMSLRLEEAALEARVQQSVKNKMFSLQEAIESDVRILGNLTAGTDNERSVGRILQRVVAYKGALEQIDQQLKAGVPLSAPALESQLSDLKKLSRQTTSQLRSISRRQGSSIAISQGFLEDIRNDTNLASRIAVTTAAVQGALGDLGLSEVNFVSDRSEANEQSLKEALAVLEESVTQLGEGTDGNVDYTDAVQSLGSVLKAYSETKDALVLALSEKDHALYDMRAAKEALGLHVDQIELQTLSKLDRNKDRNQVFLLTMSAVALLAGGIIAFLISNSISKPLVRMTTAMGRLAQNDLSVEIPSLGRGDEIGAMALALQIFYENAVQVEELKKQEELQAQRVEEERRKVLLSIADDFEQSVGAAVSSVSVTSTSISHSTQTIDMVTQKSLSLSDQLSQTAHDAGQSVGLVAAAAEELAASIQEVSKHAKKSAAIASDAVNKSDKIQVTVSELSEAGIQISEVVRVIEDIAAQTNMLAMNAKIEAERAGDVGKGFAVVAEEVKKLSDETSHATADISSRVQSIRRTSDDTISAIDVIRTTIDRIHNTADLIANSVGEQSQATAEIAQSASRASAATSKVEQGVDDMRVASSEVNKAVDSLRSNVSTLSDNRSRMSDQISDFLGNIRSS